MSVADLYLLRSKIITKKPIKYNNSFVDIQIDAHKFVYDSLFQSTCFVFFLFFKNRNSRKFINKIEK